MGRRDAVQVTLEIVARCRYYLPDLLVTYEPGWETRGNGMSANYDFVSMHHTASASSLARPFPTQTILRDGRPGLSGPLCNSGGPACTVESPRLHINAAHPANHAGASRTSGPVPALSLFNPRTWGHEIDYAGSTPMLAGQLLVALVLARAVADVLAAGNVEHVRAHAETSVTGKWDPGNAPGRTIDMAAFRRDAAALTPGGDDMPTADEIADAVWRKPQAVRGFGGAVPPIIFIEDTRTLVDPAITTAAPVGYAVEKLTGGKQELGAVVAELFERARQEAKDDDEMKTMLARLIADRANQAPPSVGTPAAAVDVTAFAAAVGGQLTGNVEFMRGLATAIATEQDRRARDGDPATGPVS